MPGPYKIRFLHTEDYSGEHREWTTEVEVPPQLVRQIQLDALRPWGGGPLDLTQRCRRAAQHAMSAGFARMARAARVLRKGGNA